jgi:hypothetical protein
MDDREIAIRELYSLAFRRDLTPEETAQVLRELDDPTSPVPKSLILNTLEETHTPEYAHHVEPLLLSQDPFVARQALDVLCKWWALCESYQPQISDFLAASDSDLRSMGHVGGRAMLQQAWSPRASRKAPEHRY